LDILKLTELAERKDLSDPEALGDLFEVVRLLEKEDHDLAHQKNKEIRKLSGRYALEQKSWKHFELNKKALLFDSPYDFDAYLQYLEMDRKPEERFYLPRRRVMKRIVDAMQRLVDGDLDELFLSMPPRVGKTSILMFFVTWLIGRDSEKSNLYAAFSDVITSAFYSGCLEVLNDPVTYKWHDVFPEAKIVSTNAKDETFNINRKKRYPSLTCRSLYGTLNGACDCNGMLISDDLIGGIEEALNKDRMISAWSKVDNNLLPRAKETAKILWCGTRWSMIDPAGLRMDLLLNDARFKNRRYEIINLPALDENEHSNFHYLYDVGFSDDYYLQRRASFERNNDMASWLAQYMGEPIERSGALFEPQDMKFYNGVLPEEDPVRIFMAVDPAFGGGDFTSAPICYQYADNSVYVHDVVFNDGDKRITQPLIVKKILAHKVQAAQFEANKSTVSYKDEIEKDLRDKGYRLNITSKAAPNNVAKEIRIRDKAPEIREFFFLEEGKRSKEYSLFMQNVYSFKVTGKNKHDDSVDSLAQAVDMVFRGDSTVKVFKRPF
jgi:predicted phage terminase large subunit-like protein